MTKSEAMASSVMGHLDQLGAQAFDGYLVRKYSRQYPVPGGDA
jgi:hypothetical protein